MSEQLISGLLFFNFGALFTLVMIVTRLTAGHANLKKQFTSLTTDFKAVAFQVHELSSDVKLIKNDIGTMKDDIKEIKKYMKR